MQGLAGNRHGNTGTVLRFDRVLMLEISSKETRAAELRAALGALRAAHTSEGEGAEQSWLAVTQLKAERAAQRERQRCRAAAAALLAGAAAVELTNCKSDGEH